MLGHIEQSVVHLIEEQEVEIVNKIFSAVISPFQEGQLTVTGESMSTQYWLNT